MMPAGGKIWFTAAELAGLALPGLPKSKRNMNERAETESWALRSSVAGAPLARPRQARGGGLEYHIDVLPASARSELAKRGIAIIADIVEPPAPIGSIWDWYERQTDAVKAEAQRRSAIVDSVCRFERVGLTRSASVASAAAEHKVGASTIWLWLKAIDGTNPNDRLALLAPRRSGGGAEIEVDQEVWSFIVSDYLRPEAPTFSSCFYRAKRAFAAVTIPCERTLRRKLEREVDGRAIIARRKGREAVMQMLPPQQRTVAHLHAMELVNIDGHKWDVFVKFPDGRIARPMMVAIQDIFSRKILAWRVGESESALLTRLAFADLFGKFGIPVGCLMDNGRAFASKSITGGAKSRFRFKIRDEEPTGVLTALGINIHWATPYHGQAKPIERAFRDMCDAIAKHPAFAGAYTGNKVDAKPENYGDRAIALDEFMKVVALGIAAHNAKPGRRTETAMGRSFDDVFSASYAAAPIGKASEEQLRLALLTADEMSTDRKSGFVTLFGNRYWTAEMSAIAGQRVTVRFDPDDLAKDVHIYDKAGRFIASAPLIEATGFNDAHAAKAHAKRNADHRKAVRRAVELEDLKTAAELAGMMPDHLDEADLPTPTVTRMVRHRGGTAAALKPVPNAPLSSPQEAVQPAMIDRLAAIAERHLRSVE